MRRMVSNAKSIELTEDLAGLSHLAQKNLNEHFRILYGVAPPAKMRRSFLIHAIAYRLQEKALGGLRPCTRRRLENAAEDASRGALCA